MLVCGDFPFSFVCFFLSGFHGMSADVLSFIEQADGARYSDVDTQHIGKIEVVVLRCDYDDLPPVEPRAQAALVAAPAPAMHTSVRAPSGRAPSGRAPSGKAPSGKAPSAASAGFGDLFGAFDGACDLDLDDVNGDDSSNAPHGEYADSKSDTNDKSEDFSVYYSSDHDISSSQHLESSDQPVDQNFIPPFGLDGHDYDYPRSIHDQYGQPSESRVPYYHTSGRQRLRQTYADSPALVDSLLLRIPTQNPRQGTRRVEFDSPAQHIPEPTSYYSPLVDQPPYPVSPVGIPYHNERYLARRSPSPPHRRHRSRSRGRRNEHSPRIAEQVVEEPPDIDPDFQLFHIFRMPEKFEALLGFNHNFIAEAVPYIHQLRKIPVTELGVEVLESLKRNLEACLARGRWPNGDLIRILEEPRDRERRRSRSASKARHSEKAKQGDRQSKHEEEHKRGRKHKRDKKHKDEKEHKKDDKHKSDRKHKHDSKQKREDKNTSEERDQSDGWNKSEDGKKSEDGHKDDKKHKHKHGKKHKHDKKGKQDDKKHKKEDKKERKDKDKHKHKSDKSRDSRSSSTTIVFFESDGGWSQKGSVKTQSDSQKNSTSSKRSNSTSSSGSSTSSGSSSSSSSSSSSQKSNTSNQGNSGDWDTAGQSGQPGGWGDTNGQQNNQGGDMFANNNNNQVSTQDTGAAQQIASQDATPNADQQNAPQNVAPNPGDGGPLGQTPSHAPSSYRSVSSRSTNPHAYVQPYFQTWRGNGQTLAAKPLPRQPREPYAYGPAPTPHLPADRVGNRAHGVRADRGADYSHKVYHPKYLDTVEDPYAVFVFNYRSAEELGHMFRYDVKGDLASIAEEVGHGVLMNLPKEKLVEELLKAQAQAPAGGDAGGSRHGDDAAPMPAPEKARSNKAPSRAPSQAQKSVIAWVTQAAQPATGQEQGFKPVSVKNDKGGEAAGGGGWAFQGGGTTGGGGGFVADDGKQNINW